MRIEDPEIYFGKKIKVTSTDGTVLTGELYGYDYDFDVEVEGGAVVSYTEDEIANIEVL